MVRPVETIGEMTRQIASLERVASWHAANGSDTDVFASAASLCRLTDALASQMRAHGIAAAETPTHRASVFAIPGRSRTYAALVTELGGPRDRVPSASVSDTDDLVPTRFPVMPPPAAPRDIDGDGPHHRLCPLGEGQTRWYVCGAHEPRVVFQAGSGYFDAVANSCPRCARISRSYVGCACEEAERPIDREKRKGRKVRLIPEPVEELEDGATDAVDEAGE